MTGVQTCALPIWVERILLSHREVVSVARRTGRAEMDEHAQGVHASELDVSLRETARSREDFLAALETNPQAKAFYATLNRQNQFAIYHRLQTAKRPETRAKRIADFVAQLAAGKRFH